MRLRAHVRNSTLSYAWCWTVIAVGVLAGVELTIELLDLAPDASGLAPARYMAAALLFCPMMSVLGAKRPHDQAWQWIVLSLWGILVLPAFEWFAVQRGASMEIHGVRAWFLLILILVTAMHAVGTRSMPIGLCVAASQSLLLCEHLPLIGRYTERWNSGARPDYILPLALILLTIALAWAVRIASNSRGRPSGLPQVWLDFRDQFGTLWALRILERMHAAAAASRWRSRLDWDGFHGVDEIDSANSAAVSPHAESADRLLSSGKATESANVQQAFWNLLRRFVSVEWCEQRGWTPPATTADRDP